MVQVVQEIIEMCYDEMSDVLLGDCPFVLFSIFEKIHFWGEQDFFYVRLKWDGNTLNVKIHE